MVRSLAVLYGLVCHVMFLLIFLYLICFLGNFLVPKTIDNGTPSSTGKALIVNTVLLGVFAIPHSVMARQRFKKWWTQFVPKVIERSTYVLVSNLLLILLFCKWEPMIGVVWEVENQTTATMLSILFFIGFGIVVISSLIMDHFDLLGTRQVVLYALEREYTPPKFKVEGFYKFVRHPLLLGWHISFWSTPRMTTGHLLFSVATTVYMLIAIRFEEQDLMTFYGDAYRNYRSKVSMLIPWRSKQ